MTKTSFLALPALLVAALGCGTTRVTDTQRTATEQLLVSNAVDQAVSHLDFRVLAGKPVFFDPQYLDGSVDRGYLVSSIRQHLLACGCLLQEDRTKSTYVVEARTGGVGTDRHALLIGVPQMTIPTFIPGQPSVIPEIPFAKKTDQKGLAKIAVYAYNRQTGKPVWQSGVVQAASTAKDTWFLGIGPVQRGTVRDGTEFAGAEIEIPLLSDKAEDAPPPVIPVTQAAAWNEPPGTKTDATPGTAAKEAILHAVLLVGGSGAGSVATPEIKLAAAQASAPTPAPAVPPAPAPTPNAGGQAETQPAKILNSGFGLKPDG